MTFLRRLLSFSTLLFAVVLMISLSHCVSDSGGPALIGVEGGVIVDEGGGAHYSISGTVRGLAQNTSVTLLLNGANAQALGDGPFSFQSLLVQGQSYAITTSLAPPGIACAVTAGSGTIASADVSGVIVSCASNDATLSALSISAATIMPAFNASTLAYTAGLRISAVFPPPTTTTVTATANDPGATITLNGIALTSGTASSPITLKSGADAIDVTVTASDGITKKQYAIALTATASDYFKASNARAGSYFGSTLAISGDGNTFAVGAHEETSNATGIDGNQNDTSEGDNGAVYVFVHASGVWTQQAYVKASNNGGGTDGLGFGGSLALSNDGNTLAVGANEEPSGATGINGNQNDTSSVDSGAVYVFTRAGVTWSQQAYIKASNSSREFGGNVALSSDGNTLAVGAEGERSDATGINGDQSDTSEGFSGATYVFTRTGTTWSQQAYIKASNTMVLAEFGFRVALSADGNTLAVSAAHESSDSTGINGNETDTSDADAGAVYIFTRTGTTWSQQAYLKASNTRAEAFFGFALAMSSDGNTLAVGAFQESSDATGINGNQNDTSAANAGAAYVFTRSGTTWTQQAYVKASNTRANASFGSSIALSSDGNSLAVGAEQESSNATGVDGNQSDTSAASSGAVYVFTRTGATWTQSHYVKASNTAANASFGVSVAFSSGGLGVGAYGESSDATGVNGNQSDTSATQAGAAYVF